MASEIAAASEAGLVTIIIVNTNTRDLVLGCIASIKRETKYRPYRIVVVDNGSTDGSVEALARDHSDVQVIRNPRNLGFGASNNLALGLPTCYFFLLNPDTILRNDAISMFAQYFAQHERERLGVVGSYLLSDSGDDAYSFGPPLTYRLILKELAFKVGGLVVNPFRLKSRNATERTVRRVATVVGAAMFLRGELIREVGVFDQRFFMYHEEADHQKRIRRAGYRNVIIPGPQIVHLEGRSFAKAPNRRRIMVQTSHVAFVRKWYGLLVYPFKMCMLVLLLLNLTVDLFARQYGVRENWRYFYMVFRERYR